LDQRFLRRLRGAPCIDDEIQGLRFASPPGYQLSRLRRWGIAAVRETIASFRDSGAEKLQADTNRKKRE
jgi:hypothetical protein